MEFKICKVCKKNKKITQFCKDSSKKDLKSNCCIICNRKRVYKWRINNPDKKTNNNLQRRYKLSLDQYNNILIEQNNSCKICQRHKTQFKTSLAVDHCHKSGIVRGLLCSDCNVSLGKLKENKQTIQNMIKYIEEHEKTQI